MKAPFRLATYNVHKCIGLDRRTSPERIAEVIAEFAPDVIGLQEVTEEAAGRIAEQTRMRLTMGGVRHHDGEPYGNAVLSRDAPLAAGRYDITVPGREARGCLEVTFEVADELPLNFFNFHLGTGYLERRRQMEIIREAGFCSRRGSPRVVVGDFNEWTRGQISEFLAREFPGADIRERLKRRRTYPGILPVLHLDHIYYDGGLELLHVELHRTRKALVASDHVPLYADFAPNSVAPVGSVPEPQEDPCQWPPTSG